MRFWLFRVVQLGFHLHQLQLLFQPSCGQVIAFDPADEDS
jgi:hypothetical protein